MLRMSWAGDSSNEKYSARSSRSRRGCEARGDAGLAGARPARDQDARAAVVAAAQHPIELDVAAGDPLRRRLVDELQRRQGEDRDPVVADEERVLVGAVPRAAVLDDPEAPRRDLVLHAQVEQDHAVGHVLLEAVARQRGLAPLAGDDGGDALVLQPAKEPVQLGAQDLLVGERRRRAPRACRAGRAWRRSSRWHGPAGRRGRPDCSRPSPRSVPIDPHVVDDELLLRDEPRQVEAERGHVGRQLVGPSPRR